METPTTDEAHETCLHFSITFNKQYLQTRLDRGNSLIRNSTLLYFLCRPFVVVSTVVPVLLCGIDFRIIKVGRFCHLKTQTQWSFAFLSVMVLIMVVSALPTGTRSERGESQVGNLQRFYLIVSYKPASQLMEFRLFAYNVEAPFLFKFEGSHRSRRKPPFVRCLFSPQCTLIKRFSSLFVSTYNVFTLQSHCLRRLQLTMSFNFEIFGYYYSLKEH